MEKKRLRGEESPQSEDALSKTRAASECEEEKEPMSLLKVQEARDDWRWRDVNFKFKDEHMFSTAEYPAVAVRDVRKVKRTQRRYLWS